MVGSISSSVIQLKFSCVLSISKFAILPMSIKFKEPDAPDSLIVDSVDAISYIVTTQFENVHLYKNTFINLFD